MRCLALLQGEHHHRQRQPDPASSRMLSPSDNRCLLLTGSWANSHSQAGKNKAPNKQGDRKGHRRALLAKGTSGINVFHISAEQLGPPFAHSAAIPTTFYFLCLFSHGQWAGEGSPARYCPPSMQVSPSWVASELVLQIVVHVVP